MTEQVSLGLDAWARLLYAHPAMTRALSGALLDNHGLTLNDYEALLRLSRAEDGRMRRVDLAEQLLLTASGVTRLLDGLEAAGLVERFAAASETHVAEVRSLFEDRFHADELAQLTELLERLPGAEAARGEDCRTGTE